MAFLQRIRSLEYWRRPAVRRAATVSVALLVNAGALSVMMMAVSDDAGAGVTPAAVVAVELVTIVPTATPEPTPSPDAPPAPQPPQAEPETSRAEAPEDIPALAETKPTVRSPSPIPTSTPQPTPTPQPAPTPDVATEPPPVSSRWQVDLGGATLEEQSGDIFLSPPSGAGQEGVDARIRRALNEAACEDLQLAIRLGRQCPNAGAYMRYADKEWASRDLSSYRENFGEPGPRRLAGPAPESLSREGALAQPVGEGDWDGSRSGASSGLVGRLPNPHPHPEYSWEPAR